MPNQGNDSGRGLTRDLVLMESSFMANLDDVMRAMIAWALLCMGKAQFVLFLSSFVGLRALSQTQLEEAQRILEVAVSYDSLCVPEPICVLFL